MDIGLVPRRGSPSLGDADLEEVKHRKPHVTGAPAEVPWGSAPPSTPDLEEASRRSEQRGDLEEVKHRKPHVTGAPAEVPWGSEPPSTPDLEEVAQRSLKIRTCIAKSFKYIF